MNDNKITTLKDLKYLKLEELYVNNNMIQDINGLSGMYTLVVIDMSHNKLIDINGLTSFDKLK